MPAAPEMVARRMAEFRSGSREAAEELIELFYPELRRLAAAQMIRERPGHTWQPTALVNELYLELIKIKALEGSGVRAREEKQAFFALAAHLMKRLLILHSRPLYRRVEQVKVDESEFPAGTAPDVNALQDVEAALSGLGAIDPDLRLLVELKVFEGVTMEQIAERLHCSERTAARRWDFARHWLEKHFQKHEEIQA